MLVRTLRVGLIALLGHATSVHAAAPASQPCAATPTPAGKLNVLLIGASGMIGSRILTEAASRGHCVIGVARHADKIAGGANVRTAQLDATDRAALTTLAREADVIVSATSPRGGGDPIQEARAVAESEIAVARATGKRLVVVGGAGSLMTPDGKLFADTMPADYRGEALAMRGVLELLQSSDIDWTFFSPPASIRPGKRTGQYRLGTTTLLTDAKGDSRISAEDFAHALVNELEKPAHVRSQMTIAY